MTLWDHLCCLGYGLEARCSGLSHLLRGHKLHWRDDVDLWLGCTGAIWCEGCPDTSDGKSSLHIWTRSWDWIMWVAQIVCSILGHPEWRHPKRWNGLDVPTGEDDDLNMVDIEDEWYCYRCGAHKESK